MAGQEIKCSVESCKYHDKSMYCSLDQIMVGKSTGEAHSKCDTECASFSDN